jgi:type I restriction enzyme S subunit
VLNKPKPIKAISKSERLFPLPFGWELARFNQVASIQSNLVDPKRYKDMPHIAPDNIESWTARLLPFVSIGEAGVFSGKHLFSAGAILYSKIRPNLAKVTKVDFGGLCSADMYPIHALIDPDFLLKFMITQDFVSQATSEDNRVAMPKINQAALSDILVPVPPLAEQRRIVAKVDELMALCDRLEAARTAREAVRDRLAAASLARLKAPDPETFHDDARFALDALPALTTRPDQIKQLRQTILNLAVRGKLVPQDANDEPASELLKRIAADKAERAVSARDRRATQIKPLVGDEVPSAIPSNWVWASFGDLTISRDGERIPVSREEREQRAKVYDYYGASGVIDKIDGYLFDKPLLLIGEDGANLINRSTPIAFIARGEYWVNNHAHVLDGLSDEFLRYVEMFINATDLKPYVTGTAQPKMNQAKMNSIPVALPPLAEQHRIVARVDALMALCDRLETRLTATATTRRRLLDALLAESLGPGDARDLEAAE